MAPYSLDICQHHPSDTAVLLRGGVDAGAKARRQGANAYAHSNSDRVAFGHVYPGDDGADGNTGADHHPVVSTHVHAYAQRYTYRHADAHGHPIPNGYVNTGSYGDLHVHAGADGHCHADRDADRDPHSVRDADRDTGSDRDADQHAHADGDARRDAHRDSNAYAHGHGDGHPDARVLTFIYTKHVLRSSVEVIPLLKQLSEVDGIAGYEGPVRDLLRQAWQPFVDEMREGKLGSLIALKKGTGPDGSTARPDTPESGQVPRPKLMVAAHMDEIGLMVTGIEKGFLRITRVGGTDRRVLLGLEVVVHGRRDLPGIVATRPPHVLPEDERSKTVPWDKLFVDVGLPAEEVERLVAVGDLISIRREMVELNNRRVAGKAMDDRACVVAVTLALEQLASVRHAWDVFAVATAQEETGLKGAITTAYGVEPDLAIVLDVTFGRHPGVSEVDGFALGEGPVIDVGPNFHPRLVAHLKKVAEAHEIPYQIEPIPGASGTDAWAIQVTREGVPTVLICIALRYMHQPVETLAVQDVERAGRLLAAFIAGLEVDFMEKLAWDTTVESE